MHQHLLTTTKHPFQQLYMPELNIPQGKTFCAIFFFLLQLPLPHNCSQIQHVPEQHLLQEPIRNYFAIKFKYINGQILYLTKFDSQVYWFVQSFFFCLQYIFFYSLDVQKFINLSVPEFTSKSQAYL